MRAYLEERADRIRGRRKKKKQARAARWRRQILRYSLLASLLYLGTSGMIRVPWALPDPEEDVKVSGNQVVSCAQIKQVLMPCLQKPVYSLNPKDLEARIRTLPGVHNAYVRRYLFPHPYIQVQIMEEFPWASVAAGPETPVCGVISETGKYIPVAQFPAVAQPYLRFFTAPCQKMSEPDVRTWANLVSFIAMQTGTPVEYVDLRKVDDIRVQAGDLQLRLGASDSTLPKRLNRLASILPVLGSIKERVDYINLGLDSNIPLKVSKFTKQDLAADTQRRLPPPAAPLAQTAPALTPSLNANNSAPAAPAQPTAAVHHPTNVRSTSAPAITPVVSVPRAVARPAPPRQHSFETPRQTIVQSAPRHSRTASQRANVARQTTHAPPIASPTAQRDASQATARTVETNQPQPESHPVEAVQPPVSAPPPGPAAPAPAPAPSRRLATGEENNF